ncbi:MAG: HK97 family phage prohead protease [Gemmatimonadota bacterium]|nr:HK97 family phage prohead protease [Gemmatimonadota bacterium]
MPDRTTKLNVQYRTAEIHADGAGFSGYASTPWVVDSYISAVKPGAFRKTIRERGTKTPVLWQHNADWPIGRPTELKEDKGGLYFNAAISEATTYGRDAMALLRDEVPLGMSFGFQTTRSRQGTKDDPFDFTLFNAKPEDVMVIEEVKLWEISLVTFAANELAAINDVRAVAEADALTTLIEHVRDGSLSDDHAAMIADLVAAYQERAAAGALEATTAPDPDLARRRNRDIEMTIALAKGRGWLGATV